MRWDIFCRVIDNYGDAGVCWRLVRELVSRGQSVRLWIDDVAPLAWMVPWAPGGTAPQGVEIRAWADAEQPAMPGDGTGAPGDVVIEAFGCHLPDAFVERMQGVPGLQWVNLEYLSAESYVERSHGLPSPVWNGPGAGLTKRFFYPGFTPRTGGLLRPTEGSAWPAAAAQVGWPRQRADALMSLRQALLDELNTHTGAPVHAPTAAPWLLAFCYPNSPLACILESVARQPAAPEAPPVQVWLAPGGATDLALAWQATSAHAQRLALHPLPHWPQAQFDAWLDACDLRLVRGEDSAVRALWSGQPHLWQLYKQDDGVHADKLDAFLDRWMAPWPAALQAQLRPWWRLWNGLPGAEDWLTHPEAAAAAWPAWDDGSPWAIAQHQSASALASQSDLCSQLMAFVNTSG
ncbi:MAG: elongation factor maturation arginine rhamnosyltransferase EarP [Pseudomonadota bacterium]|jgi:uncharacterized repeat protein (TIGR03837 family)